MDWGYVIGIIGTLCGILSGVIAARRETAKAAKEAGNKDGTILTEIGYIKANTDDIKRHQEKTDEKFVNLAQRVASVEGSAERAHKRIDRLEGLHDGQH